MPLRGILVSSETSELLVQILTGRTYEDTKFFISSVIKKKVRLQERYQKNQRCGGGRLPQINSAVCSCVVSY